MLSLLLVKDFVCFPICIQLGHTQNLAFMKDANSSNWIARATLFIFRSKCTAKNLVHVFFVNNSAVFKKSNVSSGFLSSPINFTRIPQFDVRKTF